VKLVEPESAVVDEGGLAGAWPRFANIGGTRLVRCTPAMSVSSVTSESYRPNDLLRGS
jgi:hypothetical protein